MANKIINTRIQLRYDNYENWKQSAIILLQGEIALCTIPANTAEFNNIKPTSLYKIGDGEHTFSQLDWSSSQALIDENGNNIIDTYATQASLNNFKKEYIIVSTLAERDQIEDRISGMQVYVKDINTLYIWNGNNWKQIITELEVLNLFSNDYFFYDSEQQKWTLKVDDDDAHKNSQKLITSGAVFNHVEKNIGVIEIALEKI